MLVGNDEHAPVPSAEPGITWPSGNPYRTFAERFQDPYRDEMQVFLDLVAGRTASLCTAADSLEALSITEACERSRDRRPPVEVDEVRPPTNVVCTYVRTNY